MVSVSDSPNDRKDSSGGYENQAYTGSQTKYISTDYNNTDPPTKKADLFPVAVSQQDLIPPKVIDDDDEDNLPCKWGPLWCCQALRNPKMVLFLLCCSSCVQGMAVNGFVSVIITNLERRFDLKSADTGLIASSYDIASLLSLIPVTYFGGLGRKPRWLGFGIIFMGLGSFVMAVPHYATGLYEYETSSSEFCDASRNSSVTCATTSSLYNYKYVLILGQLMHGVGAAPLYTLGVTYMDENLKQKMSSIYVATFNMCAIVGPALGFLLGGYFLSYTTDFDCTTCQITVTEESVAWVGAWWLGFLLSGGLAIIIGVLLLGFPKYLPNTAKIRAEKVSEAYGGAKAINTTESGISSVKDLPKYVKLILSNPTFIFLSLGGASEAMVVSGFTTFIPKYLESQFSISSAMAALIVGAATVPAGGGGTFIGGYLVKRLDLKVAGTIKLCVCTCMIVMIGCLAFLVKCEDISFAGITAGYSNMSTVTQVELEASCNTDCGCPFSLYNPVCGTNNVMYFSSCAAGCVNSTMVEGVKTYTNCSCVSSVAGSLAGTAVAGKCSADCNLLPVFMVVFVIVILFTFITIMPGLSATLRSVPDKQRSFALGIQWIFIRSLGSIPGPIMFGAVIDKTCQFWLNPCGSNEDGACYFYNNTTLSNYMLALALGFKTLSCILYCIAWCLYKPPPEAAGDNAVVVSSGGDTSDSPTAGNHAVTNGDGSNNSPSAVTQTSNTNNTVGETGHANVAMTPDLTTTL